MDDIEWENEHSYYNNQFDGLLEDNPIPPFSETPGISLVCEDPQAPNIKYTALQLLDVIAFQTQRCASQQITDCIVSAKESIQKLDSTHKEMKETSKRLRVLRSTKCYLYRQLSEIEKSSNIAVEREHNKNKRDRLEAALDEQREGVFLSMQNHSKICVEILDSDIEDIDLAKERCAQMHKYMQMSQESLILIQDTLAKAAEAKLDDDSITLRELQIGYLKKINENFVSTIAGFVDRFSASRALFMERKGVVNANIAALRSSMLESGAVDRCAELGEALRSDYGDYVLMQSQCTNPVEDSYQCVVMRDQIHITPVPMFGEAPSSHTIQQEYIPQQRPFDTTFLCVTQPLLSTSTIDTTSPMEVGSSEYETTMRNLSMRMPSYMQQYNERAVAECRERTVVECSRHLAEPQDAEGGVEIRELNRVLYQDSVWENMDDKEDRFSYKISPTVLPNAPEILPTRSLAISTLRPPLIEDIPSEEQPTTEDIAAEGAQKKRRRKKKIMTIFCNKRRIPDSAVLRVMDICIAIVERGRVLSIDQFQQWTRRERDTGFFSTFSTPSNVTPSAKCSMCRNTFVNLDYKKAVQKGESEKAEFLKGFSENRSIPTYYSTPMCDCEKLSVCLYCRVLYWMYSGKHRIHRKKEVDIKNTSSTARKSKKRKRKRARNRPMRAQSFVEDSTLYPLIDQEKFSLKITCHGCKKGWHINNLMAVRPHYWPPWKNESQRRPLSEWQRVFSSRTHL